MAEREAYDVGILGAGALGCAIAYNLARRNIVPVVLDRDGAGRSASGEATSWIWVHSKMPPVFARLCLQSARRYPALQDEIGPIEYLRTGGLRPAFTEADAQSGIELARSHATAGLNVQWLPREEALRREPVLSPAILGATYSPDDGHVNPFLLVRRLVAAARRLGATFLLHSGYVAVGQRPGGFDLTTGRARFEVRFLVVAAGAWVPEVGRQVGITIPLRPVREDVLVTEKLPPLLRHTLSAACQQVTGEVLLGSDREDEAIDHGAPLARIRHVAREGTHLVPALASARVIRAVARIHPASADGLPILGSVKTMHGLYVAAAAGATTLCPLIGEATAEAIAHGRLPDGLQGWNLERLWSPEPVVGAAEMRQDSPGAP